VLLVAALALHVAVTWAGDAARSFWRHVTRDVLVNASATPTFPLRPVAVRAPDAPECLPRDEGDRREGARASLDLHAR